MYLTEQRLGKILKVLNPDLNFVHNKSVPSSKLNYFRPDYRCEELKLIIEFDGYFHYSAPKQIYNDSIKDKEYFNLGYRVVRIPYFIQMCSELLFYIFKSNYNYVQDYEHGFIDDKALLPAAYCYLGEIKFLEDYKRFKFARKAIRKSLINRIKKSPTHKIVISDNVLKGIPKLQRHIKHD